MPNTPITDVIKEIEDSITGISKIDLSALIGITSPLDKALEAINGIIATIRDGMSQRNRNWDDAMLLQMKMDVWTLWRKLFEKPGALDPLPTDWLEKAMKADDTSTN